MLLQKLTAEERSAARKNTQPTSTHSRVNTRYSCFCHPAENLPGYPLSFSKAIKTKYISPQTTKFQLAPCQMPVSDQTTNRLNTNLPFVFTREPPRGKYT